MKWSSLFEQRLQTLENQRLVQNLSSKASSPPRTNPSQSSSRLRNLLLGHVNAAAHSAPSSSSAPQPRGRLRVMVRDIVRQVKLSYRKVEPLADYGVHLPHQLMCSFCGRVCLNGSLPCRSCSSVAHFLCLPVARISSVTASSTFECPQCIESNQANVSYSLLWSAKAQDEVRYALSSQLIARKMLTILRRRQFLRKKRMAVLMLAIIRTMIARIRFLKRRLAQPRVLVLNLMDLPLISIHTGLVVVTVVQSSSKRQIMRMEKKSVDALEEGFLLPGVNPSLVIVFSFCDIKAGTATSNNPRYHVVGQASWF